MNHRIIAPVLFILSLALIGLGYLLLHPNIVGWCPASSSGNCFAQSIDFGIGKPLFWSTRWLPPLFLALIFVRPEVFKTWAKVFVPLAVIAFIGIAMAPPIGNPIHLEFDRTQTTEFAVRFLVVVSATVIAWKYWRLNRKNSAS